MQNKRFLIAREIEYLFSVFGEDELGQWRKRQCNEFQLHCYRYPSFSLEDGEYHYTLGDETGVPFKYIKAVGEYEWIYVDAEDDWVYEIKLDELDVLAYWCIKRGYSTEGLHIKETEDDEEWMGRFLGFMQRFHDGEFVIRTKVGTELFNKYVEPKILRPMRQILANWESNNTLGIDLGDDLKISFVKREMLTWNEKWKNHKRVFAVDKTRGFGELRKGDLVEFIPGDWVELLRKKADEALGVVFGKVDVKAAINDAFGM